MLACVSLIGAWYCFSSLSHMHSCRRGLLGGFIDQPTQGYNGNMPSRWVRTVGVWGTGLGPACGLVVRRVLLGAGPAYLGDCAPSCQSSWRGQVEPRTVFSVRPPLAVVSGEGGNTVSTPALVSG